MKIISNYQPRPLLSFNELDRNEQAEFDYVFSNEYNDLDSPQFFRYRGNAYDIGEFASINSVKTIPNGIFDEFLKHGFDGYITESFFSGVLVSFFDKDGNVREDNVVVGRFFD